jgi:hypothetical protein
VKDNVIRFPRHTNDFNCYWGDLPAKGAPNSLRSECALAAVARIRDSGASPLPERVLTIRRHRSGSRTAGAAERFRFNPASASEASFARRNSIRPEAAPFGGRRSMQ